MKKDSIKGEIKVLGIDLAKNSFQLHGIDGNGQTVLKKKLNRKKPSAFIAKLPPCIIGLCQSIESRQCQRLVTETI